MHIMTLEAHYMMPDLVGHVDKQAIAGRRSQHDAGRIDGDRSATAGRNGQGRRDDACPFSQWPWRRPHAAGPGTGTGARLSSYEQVYTGRA